MHQSTPRHVCDDWQVMHDHVIRRDMVSTIYYRERGVAPRQVITELITRSSLRHTGNTVHLRLSTTGGGANACTCTEYIHIGGTLQWKTPIDVCWLRMNAVAERGADVFFSFFGISFSLLIFFSLFFSSLPFFLPLLLFFLFFSPFLFLFFFFPWLVLIFAHGIHP